MTMNNKSRWNSPGMRNIAAIAAIGTAALGLGGYLYARNVEPTKIEVIEISLVLPRLAPGFHGYRLVQFSDLHADGSMPRSRVEEVVRIVNSVEPDLIVITGDFVSHASKHQIGWLAEELCKLNARDGVFAVLGNHDHWAGADLVRAGLKDGRVNELRNDFHTIFRGEAALHIAGVDSMYIGMDRIDKLMENLPEEGAAILLAHEPDFADTAAATGRFDLQLSGHSHGGQIHLPYIGKPFLPNYAKKYPRGLYQINGLTLYTNRGLGMIHLPLRFNARPEISVFTLE